MKYVTFSDGCMKLPLFMSLVYIIKSMQNRNKAIKMKDCYGRFCLASPCSCKIEFLKTSKNSYLIMTFPFQTVQKRERNVLFPQEMYF